MAADQYVAETGDPSGISCFCYKETYRIDCNGRFLEICGVQFRKDYTGIFSGFDPVSYTHLTLPTMVRV